MEENNDEKNCDRNFCFYFESDDDDDDGSTCI